MKKILFIILVILALVAILPLSFNNSQIVNFDYVFGQYDIPLSWLISGSFIFGALFCLPFFALSGLRWKIKAKSLEKQLENLIKQHQKDEIVKEFNKNSKRI